MHMKIGNYIAAFALLLAGLAWSLPIDTAASGLQKTNQNTSSVNENRQPDVVSVSYEPAAYTNNDSPGEDAAVADKSSVSAVSEVSVWTLLVAVLGLAGMRLQRGGKKYLPVIH